MLHWASHQCLPRGWGWSSAVASRGSGCPSLCGPPPPPRGACCQDTGAQGLWLETLPWSGPVTYPLVHLEGPMQGVGTSCSSRAGRELLARQSGDPRAPPRHGPTHQAAPGWGGSKEKNRQSWSHPLRGQSWGPSPGNHPPVGNHTRCYLKGPRPAGRSAAGQAGPWLPGCQGLGSTCPVLRSTNTSEPLTLFYYIIIK